jgi:hypothetical protein
VPGAEGIGTGPRSRGVAAVARPKGSRPTKKKSQEQRTAGSVLPMELRVGDRFTHGSGEWEITGHPFTSRGGKVVHPRVKQIGELAVTEERSRGAHGKVTARRA